jgi:DNA-binding transcriptional ArsR family regulator
MDDVVKIFRALADPTRLRIILLLRRRELCVCELMFILGMEQSRVSHHMRILREAGIADDIREGRWIIYRVPQEARKLLGDLLAGALRERIEHSREASEDIRKLEVCIRENIRGRVCGAAPRLGGQ